MMMPRDTCWLPDRGEAAVLLIEASCIYYRLHIRAHRPGPTRLLFNEMRESILAR